MYVLKIFITGDICHFGLASFTEKPWNLAKQLFKGMLLEIALNWTNIFLVLLWLGYLIFSGGKNYSFMIYLICDFLLFYAYVHTCSPSYTKDE